VQVTDLSVAALRAQLAGDLNTHKRLLRQISSDADKLSYAALVSAAFFEAADRRFGAGATGSDVIAFVAGVRSRSEQARDALDPRTAERVVRAVIGDTDISDLSASDLRANQILLLAGLVADERFDTAALDEFMARARGLADGTVTP
jgi:hypothetical protein